MTSEIIETAKATQEVAKTTSKAIDATQALGKFVAKIIGQPLEISVGILTDKLQFMRWERQLSLLEKCNNLMKRKELDHNYKTVPLKIVIPIMENASLEEDDYLQQLWANLLVSALDPKVPEPRAIYISIIKDLEPSDAKVLNKIYNSFIKQERLHKERYKNRTFEKDEVLSTIFYTKKTELRNEIDLTDFELNSTLDSLARNRLIEFYFEDTEIETNDGTYWVSEYCGYDKVAITALGISFVRACIE
jgi:hypothetical protein